MTMAKFSLFGIVFLLLTNFACTSKNTPSETATAPVVTPLAVVAADEPIQPLQRPTTLNADKVALGSKLFHEKRLSKDNTLSCASCHDLAKGGTDLAPTSTGVGGILGPINSPTVFNSGLNFVQFWDGRAKDLVEQAAGPVHNPKEMASNWDEVLTKLSVDSEYPELFNKIYSDGMNGANITDAIAEFEKQLVTADSRFDKYLQGDKNALSHEELSGYGLFKEKGCVACHNGQNVGGKDFQKLGLVKDYFSDRGTPVTEADLGRYNVTKKDEDKHVFKVPSLRVVPLTAPYFHDASQKSLADAIQTMGRYQLGIELSKVEVSQIEAFLKSLVGEYDGKPLAP